MTAIFSNNDVTFTKLNQKAIWHCCLPAGISGQDQIIRSAVWPHDCLSKVCQTWHWPMSTMKSLSSSLSPGCDLWHVSKCPPETCFCRGWCHGNKGIHLRRWIKGETHLVLILVCVCPSSQGRWCAMNYGSLAVVTLHRSTFSPPTNQNPRIKDFGQSKRWISLDHSEWGIGHFCYVLNPASLSHHLGFIRDISIGKIDNGIAWHSNRLIILKKQSKKHLLANN